MNSESFAAALLQSEGYAAFEYLGDGNSRLIGQPAAFLKDILGELAISSDPIRPGDTMTFLENFLYEAEEFWTSQTEGRAESPMWVEKALDGRELALEAEALWLAGRRILLVRNPQARYAVDAEMLQTARDSLLEHERLLREIQKKEILLHCIVHDLSQPLTAMRGCFEVLNMEPLGEKLRSLIEIGNRQCGKQESMIRGILDAFSGELAAQQSFQKDAKNAPDLAQCAGDIAKDYLPAFAKKGASIRIDPRMDLAKKWEVVGDETRLRRIFTNLVENALRYSPAGTTVTLGAEDEGEFVRAFVDDEGPGLPEGDAQPRLFQLFGKGKSNSGKAGLGLYFCRITVERWGGTIGAERRPEKGTRFWFRLPRAASPAAHASHAEDGSVEAVPALGAIQEEPPNNSGAAEAIAPACEAAPLADQQASSVSELFDKSALLARVGGNEKLARQLAGAYLAGSTQRRSEIRNAIAERNGQALANAAHTLKSTIRSFGAKSAVETARKLEEMAREERFEGAGELGTRLETELAQLDDAIRKFTGDSGK
jgi:signal transduction histidine kinase/HPt (histidine-containing phosphotransfer) domain-containing protein